MNGFLVDAAVVLRPMEHHDLPAVLEIERALFPEDAWSEEMFLAELAGRPVTRHYLVAERDGVVVGYAGLFAVAEEGDVQTIAVRRAEWGRGIGAALLTELIAEAVRRGCREVFLEVRADNPRAQALYTRFGFVAEGVRRHYYQPSGTDAIVMRRDLGPDLGPDIAKGCRRNA